LLDLPAVLLVHLAIHLAQALNGLVEFIDYGCFIWRYG
jgi:hypothetical protein